MGDETPLAVGDATRERGFSGTAFSDVIAHSGAPRGSIYHHFPGGRSQLAEEAVRYAGEFISAGVRAATRDDDPLAAVRAFLGWWRRVRLATLIVSAVEGATILCRASRSLDPLDDVTAELEDLIGIACGTA